MHGYVYVIIKNSNYNFSSEDIEEISSDVFLVLWENQEKLNINQEITPYIAGITKNLILKKKRNLKLEDDIENSQDNLYCNFDIHIQVEEKEKISIITNQLMKMKNEDINIFIYYYYNSRSIKEIAFMLNISEIKVKSRLSRIRKKIKKELEKRGYSYE